MIGQQGDKQRLLHISDAIRKIELFTKDANEEIYFGNEMMQSAVERQLEIIGEAAAQLSDETKDKYPEIEWYKIKAFRNVIAHEYFGISSKQVWTTVTTNIPQLKSTVLKILNQE